MGAWTLEFELLFLLDYISRLVKRPAIVFLRPSCFYVLDGNVKHDS